MDPAILFVLLGALALFAFYWVVRAAVHHGILDAEETRHEAARRAALGDVVARSQGRALRVDHDPDV